MKQEELIKSCCELLYKLCDLVESRNSLNYYDVNISSEYFFIPLLNLIFECDLHNLNTKEKNAAAIDLYDTNGKIAIQVTSNSSADKIHKTLTKYCKNKLYNEYKRLVVVVIVRSHSYRADFTKDTDGKFTFSKNDDIFTIQSLIRAISALDIEKIANIQKYLEYQLDTLLDETQVFTIEQSFTYISQNTNSILNESFFEIDSDMFISDFQKKLDCSDVIHICSLSIEEGKYCILNLLHKIKPDIPVYIIKSKDTWEKAEKNLSGCILIPDFQSEEIPAINKNITIFIERSSHNGNVIKLPNRTISFLSKKLQENGYDDSYKLLQKTQGMYYYIKSELFTGKLSFPNWERDNNKAVLVAVLLGKWTECDGDKAIIEQLYGDSYETFISYLNQYMDVEDAFVVRKRIMSYNLTYRLADPFLSVYSHKNVSNLPIIDTFFDLAKSIIADCDPVFDEPFEKHYYLLSIKKSVYSKDLKTGIIRTLILLSLYCGCQEKVSHFIKELLSTIESIKDWAYISQFIELICEAAPNEVLDCFEKNIDNHTGLLDLFTAEKSDFLIGRHYYTHILWCLELLLPYKEYVVRTVSILLILGDKIEKCSTGNNPQEDLSKIFCTCINVSALSIDEKIELAELGVKNYPYFWDILYNEISNRHLVLSNSSFIFREKEEIRQYTQGDFFKLYISYINILLSNFEGSATKLIKLLDLLPKCTDEIFIDIQVKLAHTITDLCDSDKEQIKSALRKTIYRHRFFANAKWAAPFERIEKIEEFCLGIIFDDPVYDFLYLADSDELPIFNPVVFDSEADYYHKNEAITEEVIASEMKRFKSTGIDLSHYLSLINSETDSRLGRIISKYYCDSKYDENILNIIISSTDNSKIAVNYVCNCFDTSQTEIYKAIEYIRKDHYNYYVDFISILPFNEKALLFIQNLSDKDAQKYWTQFTTIHFNNKHLLDKAMENLLRYSNWNKLYFIMYEQSEMLSAEEIFAILSNSTMKMITENYPINNNEGYFIEQLISIIYQKIGNDFENYPMLYGLEMRLCSVIGWDNMKCCQYFFKRNAYFYADILSVIYKKDDSNSDDAFDSDRFNHIFKLEREIKFCPGEENGVVNEDVLNEWILQFNNQLKNQGQTYLFYRKLGELLANSPTGSDGIFPHENVRDKIEKIGNDELIDAFADSVINWRGVYTVTGGKDELKLSQKYNELSQKLIIQYPRTSKIFNIVSEYYLRESIRERERAENEIF